MTQRKCLPPLVLAFMIRPLALRLSRDRIPTNRMGHNQWQSEASSGVSQIPSISHTSKLSWQALGRSRTCQGGGDGAYLLTAHCKLGQASVRENVYSCLIPLTLSHCCVEEAPVTPTTEDCSDSLPSVRPGAFALCLVTRTLCYNNKDLPNPRTLSLEFKQSHKDKSIILIYNFFIFDIYQKT